MRKINISISLIIFLILVSACSPSPTSQLMPPSWLQDDWGVTDGNRTILITFTKDNMLLYDNLQLEIDLKSSLELNPHVEISNQGSTNTSYQVELYNTSTHSYLKISVIYTAATDSILYIESAGGLSQRLTLGRL